MEQLIGFVLPFVVDFLNKVLGVGESKIKFVVTVVVSFVIAAVIHYQELSFGSLEGFWKTGSLLFAESQIVYRMWWGDSGSRKTLLKRL